MYKIDLKPHKGVMRSILGPIEVEHDQFMIYVNGLHVGYVGKQPGAPINIFQEVGKSMLADIRAEVAKQLSVVGPVAVTPTDEEVEEHFDLIKGKDEDDE